MKIVLIIIILVILTFLYTKCFQRLENFYLVLSSNGSLSANLKNLPQVVQKTYISNKQPTTPISLNKTYLPPIFKPQHDKQPHHHHDKQPHHHDKPHHHHDKPPHHTHTSDLPPWEKNLPKRPSWIHHVPVPPKSDGQNVPTIYNNFPHDGTSLPEFYKKCVSCANDQQAFKWSPSTESIPQCNNLNQTTCNNRYCEFDKQKNICIDKKLTPKEIVANTNYHYDNVDINKLKCQSFNINQKDFIKKCQDSKYNCGYVDKKDCDIEYNNSQYCKYDKESNKCINIPSSECDIQLFNTYTKNLALTTCKMPRDGFGDDDITGRYGCNSNGDKLIPPNSTGNSICPNNNPF